MGALAHILEAEGLATVALLPSPDIAERMRPPRVLVAPFPLGRPFGRPGDAAFQRAVLEQALGLLGRPEGPVLDVFPEVIEDEAADALTCPIPARHDPGLPPAVDEARGLRAAFARAAGGGVATADPALVEEALLGFDRLANGTPWKEAGLPRDVLGAAHAVLGYYQQAALALVDHVPAARSAETWFVHHTAAGETLRAAQRALRSQGAPGPLSFYLLPATQERGPAST